MIDPSDVFSFETEGERSASTVQLVPCLEFVRRVSFPLLSTAAMLFCGLCIELVRSGIVLVQASAMSSVARSGMCWKRWVWGQVCAMT